MPTKGSVVRAVRVTREDNEAISRYMEKNGFTFNKAVHMLIREKFGSVQMDISDFIDMSGEKVPNFADKRLEYETLRLRLPKLLGTKCAHCGSEDGVEYHHIRPLQYGGTNDLSNLVPLCHSCHLKAHGAKSVDTEKERLREENKKLKKKVEALKAALVALGE